MDKEPITKEKKSRSLGLIKATSVIIIVRESITILYTYVVKSNAEYGLIHPPSEDFENKVTTIFAWGVGILLSVIIFLVDRGVISLGIVTIVFVAELVYQFNNGFIEVFGLISSLLILTLLVILWVRFVYHKL
jgi:hypothetical protein